jgi:hypothetical protein
MLSIILSLVMLSILVGGFYWYSKHMFDRNIKGH